MADSFVETQVRLVLEQQTASVFTTLTAWDARLVPAGFTLLAFDFGDKGNVAFKSSLCRRDLPLLAASAIERLSGGAYLGTGSPLSPQSLRAMLDQIGKLLPAGTGYAVLFGRDALNCYGSNAERDGVIGALRELEAHWRGGA